MVSLTTAAAASLIAFAALIEPSIQAAAALRIGAQVVGSAIGSSGGNNNRREQAPSNLVDPNGPLGPCMNDLRNEGTKLFLHKEDHTAILTPVPASCVAAVKTINDLPNIADIEAKQGKMEVVDANSIRLSGVDGEVQRMLEKSATAAA